MSNLGYVRGWPIGVNSPFVNHAAYTHMTDMHTHTAGACRKSGVVSPVAS